MVQTQRLRGILEWRDEVTSSYDSASSDEVMILIWPAGHFKRLPRGTTASQVVRDQVSHLAFCSTPHCIIATIRFARVSTHSKPSSYDCYKFSNSGCAEAFLSWQTHPFTHIGAIPVNPANTTEAKAQNQGVCVCLPICTPYMQTHTSLSRSCRSLGKS